MNHLKDWIIKGRDISVYEKETGIVLDIKHPCGELIKGWEHIEKLYMAERLAATYVYALGDYTEPHCDDEYCIEACRGKNMNVPAQIESQVKHILRMYENAELEEKFIDLCLEWLNKGIKEGARIARHVDKHQEEIHK